MYTLDKQILKELLASAATAAVRAGARIMPLFTSDDYEITMKSDNSPVSLADRVAHKEIEDSLAKTRIPILSEEGRDIDYDERKAWDIFWLIDPLDGTRQFIQNRTEFTVNIALIINDYPELGVIYAPAYKELYIGHYQLGAYKIDGVDADLNANYSYNSLIKDTKKMPTNSKRDVYTILASPNHTTHATVTFIDEMREKYNNVNVMSIGSSLKMCYLADGRADVYLRHADTYEWDTAAAQAILEGAGCTIKSLDTHQRLTYNKESLINPWFICQKQD